MEKYYQILGLKPGASEKEIVETYKVLVKVWNPDRFKDDPNIQKIATEKIKEIDEAFKQLLIWTGIPPEKGKEIQEPQFGVTTEPPGTRGSIVIQTEPLEAEVYFNEKFVGTSPCKAKHLPVGSYRVRVIKEGYQIWEQDVDICAGAEKEVFAKLKLKEPESGEIWKDPYLGMEFVYVKGGRFEMGDIFGDGKGDEKPIHWVHVDGFWISKYPVTQGVWKKLMDNNPSRFKSGDNYPVEQVLWYDVEEFIRRLNEKTGVRYRLPTEAEWEYAARGGGKKEKWAGTNSESEILECAWYQFNSYGKTQPVGQKKPNSLGLHDMSGNVWEWVQDWYDKHYYRNSPPDNPQGPGYGEHKVIRGGAWESGFMPLRTVDRHSIHPRHPSPGVGFRLVLPTQPEQTFIREREQPFTSEEKPYGTLIPPSHIVEYAGFWKRFAAFIIDSILMTIVTYIVYLIFIIPGVLSGAKPESGILIGWIMGIIVNWLYWAVMESSSRQATLGKMALGIIVTDYAGKRVSFGRATGRQFARIISALILLIGYIMAGFTEKKQALHDMIAECLVVVKK